MDDKILLTINIPTYNRGRYLERCLQHLYIQKDEFQNLVEINIFDNHSTDNTSAIVDFYIKRGLKLGYIINDINIGPDRNIGQCYLLTKGKYVLVLGDDDILLSGSIKAILRILKNDYGLIHLNFYSFKNDFSTEKPYQFNKKIYLYPGERILKYVLINASLISANIVNTKYISKVDIDEAANTNLNQLPGILNAATRGAMNVFVNKYLLAQQSENSGGYAFFNVFGVNFPNLISKYLNNNKSGKKWIKGHLLKHAIPYPLHQLLKKDKNKCKEVLQMIKPYFKTHFAFWIFIYPIVNSPVYISYFFLKLCQVYNKLYYTLMGIHLGKALNLNDKENSTKY